MSDSGHPPDDKTVVFGRSGRDDVPAAAAALSAAGTPRAKLVCLDTSKLPDPAQGLEIDLTSKEQTVGRAADLNTVPINATGISKKHARLYFTGSSWRIEDMGSTNGVFVNDAKVQDSPLAAGDTVKIGKIKFQFVMVRPDIKGTVTKDGKKHEEDFDPDKTVSERTMFVSSNLMAAAMLLDAKAKQDAEKAAPAGPPGAAAARGRGGAVPAARPKKGGAGKFMALVVLLAAVGGGVYWFGFRGGAGEDELVQNTRTEVKRFMRDTEDGASRYSKADHEQQKTVLANVQAGLGDGLARFPQSLELQALMAQVAFLQFERGLSIALADGDIDAARQLFATAETEYEKVAKAGETAKAEEIKQTIGEVGGLLGLAGPVIEIKAFVKKYPSPSKDANPQPSREEMDKVGQMRKVFADLKKKNNLALSVSYPFFNYVVTGVDEKDILLLDKWGMMAGAK